jgi:hypothetical protein
MPYRRLRQRTPGISELLLRSKFYTAYANSDAGLNSGCATVIETAVLYGLKSAFFNIDRQPLRTRRVSSVGTSPVWVDLHFSRREPSQALPLRPKLHLLFFEVDAFVCVLAHNGRADLSRRLAKLHLLIRIESFFSAG